MSAQRPNRPRPTPSNDSEDFEIVLAPPRPLIPPGIYTAKSTAAYKDHLWTFDRYSLRLTFTVFAEPYEDGVVLTTGIEAFYSLGDGKRPPGPSSRIARLFALLDPSGATRSRSASMLKNKLWRVQIATVETDRRGNRLPEALRYSKVDVLERIG
jgi:hypothetical protein